MKAVMLVDCDNFFVSCERLFRPDLKKVPVLVLSSNDGCAISRSNEVKKMGIKMGEPYFNVRNICERNNVAIFSSNLELYKDISHRVMSVLKRFSNTIEVYSIDEAFLELDCDSKDVHENDLLHYAKKIYTTVLHEIGIPVSIGVSHTKTLAKVAAHIAKPKFGGEGCVVLFSSSDVDEALQTIDVGEVWGIGKKYSTKLNTLGIQTAHDLVMKNEEWILRQTNVLGLRIVTELKGQQCFKIGENIGIRKSLMSSQSFGRKIFSYDEICSAIAHHARIVAEMLREEEVMAREVSIVIRTSQHKGMYFSAHDSEILSVHTNDTLTIVKSALTILARVYKSGFGYAKAGVLVKDIIPEGAQAVSTLFEKETNKNDSLMKILDTLQYKYGSVLKVATEIQKKNYQARREYLSPRSTTRWSEVCKI
jgi:DNA polymerase V